MDTQPTPSDDPGLDDDLGHAGVRDLLAAQPSPEGMPEDVFVRISAALDQEQATRHAAGGLTEELGLAEVSPLIPTQRQATSARRRRWPRVLTAAAGVAAVGLLGTLAVRATAPQTGSTAALPGSNASSRPGAGDLHIQLSTSAYTQEGLASQARALLNAPSATIGPSDVSRVGPIATPAGLDACLTSLGEPGQHTVSVDIATFEGAPAAIIVVTKANGTEAYAVRRECSTGDPQILQDSVPVP